MFRFSYFFVVICALLGGTLRAMEEDHLDDGTIEKHLNDPYRKSKRHLQLALVDEHANVDDNLQKAGRWAQQALNGTPNGYKAELKSIVALSNGKRAYDEDDFDDALSCCADVLHTSFNEGINLDAKKYAMHIVQALAQARHVPSQTYFIKQALNSSLKVNHTHGLNEFTRLFAQRCENESDEQLKSIWIRESGIVDDIKRLSDQGNKLAQAILLQKHIIQAVLGKTLFEEQATDLKKELGKAFDYANQYFDKRCVGIVLQMILTPKEGPPQKGPRIHLVSSDEDLLMLEEKELKDPEHLYMAGKQLLQEEQQYQFGVQCLRHASALGHPFATELMGDVLHKDNPNVAAAYYQKSISQFTSAPRDSKWRFCYTFKHRTLQHKLQNVLGGPKEDESPQKLTPEQNCIALYERAKEYGNNAALIEYILPDITLPELKEVAAAIKKDTVALSKIPYQKEYQRLVKEILSRVDKSVASLYGKNKSTLNDVVKSLYQKRAYDYNFSLKKQDDSKQNSVPLGALLRALYVMTTNEKDKERARTASDQLEKNLRMLDSLAAEPDNKKKVQDLKKEKQQSITDLARTAYDIEAYFANNQEEVDTLFLEALGTTGVLDCLDGYKDNDFPREVLIQALTLRGRVGRGYVLPQKNVIAHYKKALQLMVAPEKAIAESLGVEAPDKVVLTPVAMDSLPAHHRMLYMQCLFGIVEQRMAGSEKPSKAQARYMCKVMALARKALDESRQLGDEKEARKVFFAKYYELLPKMYELARASGSWQQMVDIGKLYLAAAPLAGLREKKHIYICKAHELIEKAYNKIKNKKALRKDVANIKPHVIQATLQQAEVYENYGQLDQMRTLLERRLKEMPQEQLLQWELAHVYLKDKDANIHKKGVGIIKKLAKKGHRDAHDYLAKGYYQGVSGILEKDCQKAIDHLKFCITHIKKNGYLYREKLAKIYHTQALAANDCMKQRLLEKVKGVLRPVKNDSDGAHAMFVNTLVYQKRFGQVWQALREFPLQRERSQALALELAEFYNTQAALCTGKLSTTFLERACTVLEPHKDGSPKTYGLWLELLFDRKEFDQLEKECEVQKESYEGIMQKCFKARALLQQKGAQEFDTVRLCIKGAFEELEKVAPAKTNKQVKHYMRAILEASGSTDPETYYNQCGKYLQEATLKILELAMKSCCTDPKEGGRLLAYGSYYGAKVALILPESSTEWDAVLSFLKQAATGAQAAQDPICSGKVFDLLCNQACLWAEKQKLSTDSIYAKMAWRALSLAKQVCSSKDSNLQAQLSFFAKGALQELKKVDATKFNEKNKQTFELQKKLLIAFLQKLSQQKEKEKRK